MLEQIGLPVLQSGQKGGERSMKLMVINGPNLNMLGIRKRGFMAPRILHRFVIIFSRKVKSEDMKSRCCSRTAKGRSSTFYSVLILSILMGLSLIPEHIPIIAMPSTMPSRAMKSRLWRCIFPMSTSGRTFAEYR